MGIFSLKSFVLNMIGKIIVLCTGNLTKVRPLFTLSHRGSDNSPLLIVFKWTLYELCLCIYYIMILTNQIPYFKRSAVFLKMTKSFSLLSIILHHDFDQSNAVHYFWRWQNCLAYFQLHKSNDWLVSITSTEHDQ